MTARVQADPFDPAAELAGFGTGAGAVVTFTGLVRDEGGRLTGLQLEHYPGMTEAALTGFGTSAAARFGLTDWLVIHRIGTIAVGQPIMMIATAAAHRRAAFQAADYLMDWLKSRAPFWKREILPTGPGPWVEARPQDEADLSRWDRTAGEGDDGAPSRQDQTGGEGKDGGLAPSGSTAGQGKDAPSRKDQTAG